MGRDTTHAAELTAEMRSNARRLLDAVNQLLDAAQRAIPELTLKVNSGWRPPSINAAAGGKPRSRHLLCLAVDLEDTGRLLARWIVDQVALLEELDLAIETPEATPTWIHVQKGAPPSGRRIYIP